MSADSKLSIERIYGTSSNNQLNFAKSTNLVAYIASGGVVVAPIDKSTGTLQSNQRFFCAYNAKNQSSNQTGANSYLNLFQNQQPSEEKDQYGNPKLQSTITINNSTDINTQMNDLSLSSSPPKQAQKIKTITCIAISPDEKLLAVGETGSQPRILIFSLAPDSNDHPILSLSEHNFGILAVGFSPDSKYLLSVGVNHDSFLYLWHLDGANTVIVGANRCTSQINGLLWINQHIVTFGIRHIKIWKFEKFETKSMIDGKSVILGDFLNGNFVHATGDDIDDLLFLTATGEICLYDPAKNALSLRYIFKDQDEKVGAILRDAYNSRVWFGSDSLDSLSPESLEKEIQYETGGCPDSPSKVKFYSKIAAIYEVNEQFLIYLTSDEEIQLFDRTTSTTKPLIDTLSKSITGVKSVSNGKIVNWTKEGVVKVIGQDNLDIDFLVKVDINDLPNKIISNHVTALDVNDSNEIIIGDAYGNLSTFDESGQMTFTTPTHEFTVNDVCYFRYEGFEIIVSIGRDRMIQVLAKKTCDEDDTANNSDIGSQWSVFQTLDDHKGNLLDLKYHDGRIFVSSADRSITIHKFFVDEEGLSIEKEKTISVKSSPLAMTLYKEDLVVSTNDKNITVYNTTTLESTRSFKLYDNGNESMLVDNVQVTDDNVMVCSCSDKSIRSFSYLTGKQLSVNWGHSEAIKQLVLISKNHLITLSNSGCLFTWSLNNKSPFNQDSSKSTIQKYSDFTTPPKVTRKIKKPLTASPSTRKAGSSSVARSPVTSRLQTTARLTPSKLTNSTKTNLSPSSTKSSPRQTSPKASNTPTTPTISRFNPRSSMSVNNRSRISELSERKLRAEDIITYLKEFKENIGTYSVAEVEAVKKEIKELFNYEEELIIKYNTQMMDKLNELMKN